jgi:hypothetical protein
MHRKSSTVALALLLTLTGTARSSDTGGAKELFYDPTDSTVLQLSRDGKTRPAKPDESRTEPKAKPSKPGATPVRRQPAPRPIDSSGRSRIAATNSSSVLGLSHWIELEGPGGATGAQVAPTRVFRSGERIRLHFQSNADGHIALIQLGSSGTGQMLFPNPAQGLTDNRLMAGQARALPSPGHWFRFDQNPGTERLIVVFARSVEELNRFRPKSQMDERETGILLADVQRVKGSKDLFIETDTRTAGEVGTYGVNVAGLPVVFEIALQHQ